MNAEQTTTTDHFADLFNLQTREASALAARFDDTDEIVSYLEDGGNLTDVDGVGQQTSYSVSTWFEREHPDALRRRYEQDEGICTEYTTDHGLADDEVGDDEFVWAFCCPRCGQKNRCKGDPANYRNRCHACVTCRWVSLLESNAIDEFREEAGVA